MRYKEILPKMVVVLFGLTLYLYGVYERSIGFSIYGTPDTASPAGLIVFRIGQIFCFTLLVANVCFVLYLKAQEKPSLFQSFVAMITNGMIAFAYRQKVMPSLENAILWVLQAARGEFYSAPFQTYNHFYLHSTLSFLSISSILIFGCVFIRRNVAIPVLHRLAAAKKLTNN